MSKDLVAYEAYATTNQRYELGERKNERKPVAYVGGRGYGWRDPYAICCRAKGASARPRRGKQKTDGRISDFR